MKNLIVYPHNSLDVHLAAVGRKKTSDSKRKLISIENNVRTDYSEYDLHFYDNKLEYLQKKPFYQIFKSDLQSLYDYQNKTITEVKGHIEKLQVRTIRNTCQNCTINSANTLDHILPQGDFPEYIVNPKNLFPCCSQCNSYKNKYLEANGVKLFLNLYLDNLPEEQYLFVHFDFDENDEIDFNYRLENYYGIDDKIFALIESHYEKLHLLERMRLRANEVYSEIENSILSGLNKLSLEMIFEEIKENISNDQKAYGFNHWKCVLKLALINDMKYSEYIEEKKERTRA
ncbi:MAG: hypothetical protein PHV20_05010 [Bacteroidales bacterium]|nr:hypothetical protein [Bacteroidales bacterium]